MSYANRVRKLLIIVSFFVILLFPTIVYAENCDTVPQDGFDCTTNNDCCGSKGYTCETPSGGGDAKVCTNTKGSPNPYPKGDCDFSNNICYTGDLSDPSPNKPCGVVKGYKITAVRGPLGGWDATACKTDPAVGFNTSQNGTCCEPNDTPEHFGPTPMTPCPQDNGICKTIPTALGDINVENPVNFIEKLFAILLSISGGIALVIIIISGYRFVVSRGDAEKVKNAREAMTSAIVGLIFIIFSLAILQVITVDIFHIPGFTK